MRPIIVANDVKVLSTITYPQIQIERNKTTFIVGDSGCGKSTFLKILNQTVTQDCGEIIYNDSKIETYDTIELRKQIILVAQTCFLFDMSIRDNFKEFYNYREKECPSDEKIKEFLNLCCIDFSLDTMCQNMSGGERQRVFIAINLSLEPVLMMLDEPTSALDEANASNVIKNIKDYANKNAMTLLIVCHDKCLAEKYADEIIKLEKDF